MGVFSGFFLLDENVTLILCDNLLFQSINRINSACKISFDHRAIPGQHVVTSTKQRAERMYLKK